MVEGRSPPRSGNYSNVYGDLPDFVSPIDGKTVHGRRGMREQFARHGVTHASDFKDTWKQAAERRATIFSGGRFDNAARRAAIIESYNKHRR